MNKSILPYFILVLLASCKQEKKIKSIDYPEKKNEQQIRDTLICNADTINNKPIGKGFYKNSDGDIFELKITGAGIYKNDESLWASYMFLDDEIKDGDWDKPGKLKTYIDIDSYAEDSLSFYSKDKGHVYWVRSSSDGPVRFVVREADPKTFVAINTYWSKDSKHVFYSGAIVKKADPKTIYSVGEAPFDTARDKKHLFVQGEMIN